MARRVVHTDVGSFLHRTARGFFTFFVWMLIIAVVLILATVVGDAVKGSRARTYPAAEQITACTSDEIKPRPGWFAYRCRTVTDREQCFVASQLELMHTLWVSRRPIPAPTGNLWPGARDLYDVGCDIPLNP